MANFINDRGIPVANFITDSAESVAGDQVAEGPCPYCPGRWAKLRLTGPPPVGANPRSNSMLTHTMNPCPEFIRMDAQDYLERTRGN